MLLLSEYIENLKGKDLNNFYVNLYGDEYTVCLIDVDKEQAKEYFIKGSLEVTNNLTYIDVEIKDAIILEKPTKIDCIKCGFSGTLGCDGDYARITLNKAHYKYHKLQLEFLKEHPYMKIWIGANHKTWNEIITHYNKINKEAQNGPK